MGSVFNIGYFLCLWDVMCCLEEILTPQKIHTLSLTQRLSNEKQMFPDRLSYKLFIEGRNHTIHLQKNRQLIAQNYTEIYYGDDGSVISRNPDVKDWGFYHGHVELEKDSSVSVGICSGIRGLVRLKDQMYVIDDNDGDPVIYKHKHPRQKRTTFSRHQASVSASLKSSRWNMKTFNIPRYVEMFLVVDNTEYRKFGSNLDTVRARMLEVMNHVDKLYRPLNIRVVLVGLEVWSSQDQIVVSVSSDDTLSRFIEWRKRSLLTRVKHDNAQFVTGIDFLGDTVGLANRFAMCSENSAGVNQDHNENPLGLASTIAHELGHNMGLSHDKDHCSCATHNSMCIMNEHVGKLVPDLFSDCSLEQMNVFLDNVNPSCLLNPPTSDRLDGGSLCGNDVVDTGEECDCGSAQECDNPCCDAITCRFTHGSQCAHGDCCENCQIKSSDSLCRDSVNECDLVEYCTGLSHQCPPDDFHMNGVPCSEGYCYNGRCPTHLHHCQSLWGTGASVASDTCFYRNTFGRNDSHCGKTTDGYRACTKGSMFCGKIFCVGGNEYPVTGQKAIISSVGGLCNIAGDGSEYSNLSMVPTGTKCGHNKVCYSFTCQDVKVYGSNEDCSLKCNRKGICNQKNECHCDPGWAPPYCDVQYSQLTSRWVKTVSISVTAAVLFLLLGFAVFGVFYHKKRKAIIQKTEDLSAGQINLLQDHSAVRRNLPHISEPIFIESSVTPAHLTPVPPPPPPKPKRITQGQKLSPPPVPPPKLQQKDFL